MKPRLMLLALVFAAIPASGDVIEVALKLPLKARIAISGDETIGIAPFLIMSNERDTKTSRASKIDVQAEFARYLKKQLNKASKLKSVDIKVPRLPGGDMKALEENRDFWKRLGEESGADLIVSGVIDFNIEDKAGFKTEEYISPVDGRTYYRQVLIETTGFVFDIIVGIFDADTGEKLVEENFRDFKEFDQRNYDEILGLFENLRSLETQLMGIFASQETAATRYVFTK